MDDETFKKYTWKIILLVVLILTIVFYFYHPISVNIKLESSDIVRLVIHIYKQNPEGEDHTYLLFSICTSGIGKGLLQGSKNTETALLPGEAIYCLHLNITSKLPMQRVPVDPVVDFGRVIKERELPGVLDPNTIEIINTATGKHVEFARGEDFSYGDKGTLEFVIMNPEHQEYDICFKTAEKRLPLLPQKTVPLVGIGDLLHYNAGESRPINLIYPGRLVDLTGDGKRDLVGCWNYAHRPGRAWDGIFLYPRTGESDSFEFGDVVRIRYKENSNSKHFKYFSHIYMTADFADLNRDGLIDIVYSPKSGDNLYLFLNSGKYDDGGMPVFITKGSIPRQGAPWNPVRAIDLNCDGVVDIIAGNSYMKNINPDSWPVELASAVQLNVDKDTCFFDVDGNGKLDAVGLITTPESSAHEYFVSWRKNPGGDPPQFGPSQVIKDINPLPFYPFSLAAVTDGQHRGILVDWDINQRLSFYKHNGTGPSFEHFGTAQSLSALVSLSDQAWPCICDWDSDGLIDLIYNCSGSHGEILAGTSIFLLRNAGTREKPVFENPEPLLCYGEPIKITNHGPHAWAGDMDGDGKPDILACVEWSVYPFYTHAAIEMKKRPEYKLQYIDSVH